MAQISVYLPDDLAAEAKAAGLNVSSLTQEALRSALAARRVDGWLADLGSMPSLAIDHDAVVDAIAAAKDDLEGQAPSL